MRTERSRAKVLGTLFIVAAAASVIGLVLYGPILNNSDYLLEGPTSANQIVGGALAELVLAAAAVGTSITFYPLLRRRNETVALGYVTFRLFEAVLIVIGLLSLLSLLSLRQAVASGAGIDAPAVMGVGTAMLAIHDWTFILGPNFMLGINTALYSSLLYRSGLIPRPLATLGLVGSTAVFLAALLEMFGVIRQVSVAGGVLSLPVAAFEMSLAIYLIVKGFKETSPVLRPVPVSAG
jgi:hypothetical protein